MSKIWSKIKNFYITNSQRGAEFSKSREKEALPTRDTAIVECLSKTKKSAEVADIWESRSETINPALTSELYQSEIQNAKAGDKTATKISGNVGSGADDLLAFLDGQNHQSGGYNQQRPKDIKSSHDACDVIHNNDNYFDKVRLNVQQNNDRNSPEVIKNQFAESLITGSMSIEAKNTCPMSRKISDNVSILTDESDIRSNYNSEQEDVNAKQFQPGTRGQKGLLSEDRATSAAGRSVLNPRCPYCNSEDFVKRGTRIKKTGKTQLYLCKSCNRAFTPSWTKGRQYSWQTILDAISYYNLGFSLEKTGNIMKQKFQTEVSPSTVAAWVEQHKGICAYSRMRPFAVKEFSPYEVIETCTLAHRQLYRFRYHRAKIKYIMEDDFKHYKFYPLKEFLDNVSGETPHQYFSEGLRASESPIKFSKEEMIVRAKQNYATQLAGLVFKGVEENKQRHEALQRFFIANDSVTVATEVPVYIRKEDLEHMQTQLGFKIYRPAADVAPAFGKQSQKGQETAAQCRGNVGSGTLVEVAPEELPRLITGHIDFLQIRNGAIHILDYKPNAAKEHPIEQLTLYALALSRLTGLRVFHFKCAWFDEKDYFEFFPLHAVYKPCRGRRKVYTKEGVYDLNEKADKMEFVRPNQPERKKEKMPF